MKLFDPGSRLDPSGEDFGHVPSEDGSERLLADAIFAHADTLFGNRPDAVAIHHRGRLAYANESLGRLLGLDPESLLGRPALDLYPGNEIVAALSRLQAALHDGPASRPARQRLRRGDGALVDVEVSLLVVPLARDGPLVVEVFRSNGVG